MYTEPMNPDANSTKKSALTKLIITSFVALAGLVIIILSTQTINNSKDPYSPKYEPSGLTTGAAGLQRVFGGLLLVVGGLLTIGYIGEYGKAKKSLPNVGQNEVNSNREKVNTKNDPGPKSQA